MRQCSNGAAAPLPFRNQLGALELSQRIKSGYRVIYYYWREAFTACLLAIYPKAQQIDMTPRQRQRLPTLAAELKAAAKTTAKLRRSQ